MDTSGPRGTWIAPLDTNGLMQSAANKLWYNFLVEIICALMFVYYSIFECVLFAFCLWWIGWIYCDFASVCLWERSGDECVIVTIVSTEIHIDMPKFRLNIWLWFCFSNRLLLLSSGWPPKSIYYTWQYYFQVFDNFFINEYYLSRKQE